jgi:hypothetical protein
MTGCKSLTRFLTMICDPDIWPKKKDSISSTYQNSTSSSQEIFFLKNFFRIFNQRNI